MHELLKAVLAVSAKLELSAVLRTIVDASRELVEARYGALGVLDTTGQFVELITSGDGSITGRYTRQDGSDLPHGTGLLGELIRDPRPLRVDNLPTHPGAAGFPSWHPVMTTFLGVAITVRDQVYGNLYLTDKYSGNPFTDEDEEVVTALAGAAGVAIENARLYQQLRQATEDFQRRLLPVLPELTCAELQARYLPSTDVPRIGGDWYDVIHLPDDVPCLIVGDVMGHDVQAATMMSQISNMLRVIAFEQREPPSSILQRLDGILHHLHGGPMATVLVARLEHNGGHWLWWASAGHPPPLLITSGGRTRYLHGADQGLPLGVDPELPRLDCRGQLPARSTLLLYTDGLVERPGFPLDHGMEDLASTAAAHARAPLPELCDTVIAARGADLHDDIALLAIRLD